MKKTLTLNMFLNSAFQQEEQVDNNNDSQGDHMIKRQTRRRKSILENLSILNETRPYSQKELQVMRDSLFNKLNLSKQQYANHSECNHVYYVKNNGRKFHELEENCDNKNVGSCSVCWQLRHTPNHLKNTASDYINLYQDIFINNRLTFYNFQIEKIFYTWLYTDINN